MHVVDVREHPSGSCASLTNDTFDTLPAGESFELVADHDPVGLRYMFEAERSGQFDWTALEDGPEVWRAQITRRAESAPG